MVNAVFLILDLQTYELVSSEDPLPVTSAIHTIRLRRITNNNTTFVEWTTVRFWQKLCIWRFLMDSEVDYFHRISLPTSRLLLPKTAAIRSWRHFRIWRRPFRREDRICTGLCLVQRDDGICQGLCKTILLELRSVEVFALQDAKVVTRPGMCSTKNEESVRSEQAHFRM